MKSSEKYEEMKLKLEEIRRIDPDRKYTKEEMEERIKRIPRKVFTFKFALQEKPINLRPCSRQQLPQSGNGRSSLNIDYFRNSIALDSAARNKYVVPSEDLMNQQNANNNLQEVAQQEAEPQKVHSNGNKSEGFSQGKLIQPTDSLFVVKPVENENIPVSSSLTAQKLDANIQKAPFFSLFGNSGSFGNTFNQASLLQKKQIISEEVKPQLPEEKQVKNTLFGNKKVNQQAQKTPQVFQPQGKIADTQVNKFVQEIGTEKGFFGTTTQGVKTGLFDISSQPTSGKGLFANSNLGASTTQPISSIFSNSSKDEKKKFFASTTGLFGNKTQENTQNETQITPQQPQQEIKITKIKATSPVIISEPQSKPQLQQISQKPSNQTEIKPLIQTQPQAPILLFGKNPLTPSPLPSFSKKEAKDEQKTQVINNPINAGSLFGASLFASKTQPANKQEQKSEPLSQEIAPTRVAIGRGGSQLQLPPLSFFSGDKNKTNNTFNFVGNQTQPDPSPAAGSGLFGSQPLTGSLPNTFLQKASTGGLFGGNTSSLFNGSIGVSPAGSFGGSSLFNQHQAPAPQVTVGQQQQEEDNGLKVNEDGLVVAQDNCDPTKSTKTYDYVKNATLFKDQAVKFRQGSKDVLDNVTVSLQQFQGSDSVFFIVRLSNKIVSLNGRLVPKVTKVSIMNNNPKNLKVEMLFISQQSGQQTKSKWIFFKVQLKDELIGQKLYDQIINVIA